MKIYFKTFDPSLRRGPPRVSRPGSATAQPRPSSAQPQISKSRIADQNSRSTNYDRPWMSASKSLSKTMPISTKSAGPGQAMTRTVDLTVASQQHEMKRKMNEKIMKDKSTKKVVDKMAKDATSQIIKIAGKRQIVDMENEEIQLKFDVSGIL